MFTWEWHANHAEIVIHLHLMTKRNKAMHERHEPRNRLKCDQIRGGHFHAARFRSTPPSKKTKPLRERQCLSEVCERQDARNDQLVVMKRFYIGRNRGQFLLSVEEIEVTLLDRYYSLNDSNQSNGRSSACMCNLEDDHNDNSNDPIFLPSCQQKACRSRADRSRCRKGWGGRKPQIGLLFTAVGRVSKRCPWDPSMSGSSLSSPDESDINFTKIVPHLPKIGAFWFGQSSGSLR